MIGFAMFRRYGSLDEVWITVGEVQEVYEGGGGTTIRHRGGSCQVSEDVDTVLKRLLETGIQMAKFEESQ